MPDKKKFNIEYLRILAQKLQGVPAWRDLANACSDILGREIDEKRRKLEKMRDSVQYRKGDVLVDIVYDPTLPFAEKAYYLGNEEELPDSAAGIVIPNAIVEQVYKSLTYKDHPRTTDLLELRFTHNNSDAVWFMPIENPQEREVQVRNAFISGFDFFNNKINDEDLQRVYEFIQLYWDEAGASDEFMKFIGFIKNAQLEIIPLWSYDDHTDYFPVLTPRDNNTMIPVWEGGKWYQTSHVEIRYDLRQFNETYQVDMTDLEDLFYFFAPIILVLERISPTIDYPFVLTMGEVGQITVAEQGAYHEKLEVNWDLGIILIRQDTICEFAVYHEENYTPPFDPQITISGNTIAENSPIGTLIGELSVINGIGEYTFSISEGDEGIGLDPVETQKIKVAGSLDFETKPNLFITFVADNGISEPVSRTLEIVVLDVEEIPVNLVIPELTTDGETGVVNLSDGLWLGQPFFYDKKYQRDGVEIVGATGGTYNITDDDIGTILTGSVSALNQFGSSLPVLTLSLGPITGLIPENITPPTMNSETFAVGETHFIDPGTWKGVPAPEFSDFKVLNAADDSVLATGQNVLFTPAMEGLNFKLQVKASNMMGEVIFTTGAFGPVESGDDLTPPEISDLIITPSDTGAIFEVKASEDGVLYGVVIDPDDLIPDAQQIKEGKNGGGAGAIWVGSILVTPYETWGSSPTGLNPGTEYRLCLVEQDAAGHFSDVLTMLFTTTGESSGGEEGAPISVYLDDSMLVEDSDTDRQFFEGEVFYSGDE